MNFYSYSVHNGMKFHPTGKEAKEAADAAIREMSIASNNYPEELMKQTTWGEVTERAASTGEVGFTLKRQERLSYEAAHPQEINGRRENANGDLVLMKNIHESDLLEHDLVLTVACIWLRLAGILERFKQHNFEDITAFVDLLFEKYQVKRGGTEGNMSFSTFDRKFKLTLAIQKGIDFGPEIQVAREQMMAAVDQMGGEHSGDLKTIVTAAFTQIDGKLRVAEILRLRSYKIENPLWNEAMQTVNDAIEVISKKKQIRLYERGDQGQYDAVPLNIAAL
ncbi:MAG: DUF3164 family protein [Desulfuromonadaceae bacterium]